MYVANFTKESVHDYAGFFNQPIESEEITSLRNEIKRLQNQLEESASRLELLKGSTETDMYTPAKTQIILHYQGRYQNFDFNLNTGLPYDGEIDNCQVINVGTKQGEINIFMGYSYPLASAIIRKVKYSISPDNSKIIIKTKEEVIIPLLEKKEFYCHYNGLTENYCGMSNILSSLEMINASEFIQTFYGIDIEVSFSLALMREYAFKNASFEIILRTARPKDIEVLANIFCEKSIPIHKILKVTKDEYNTIIEQDCLKEFIWIMKYLQGKEKCFTNPSEVISYLESCKNWTENLEFYNIYCADLYEVLLKNYFGTTWEGWENFPEYYSIGKFSNYVVNETINQGFTSISKFISTLRDYIKMCVDIGFTPHLYTTSLALTHSVASRNHKIAVTKEQENIFKFRYEGFKPFEFEDYIIIAPSKSNDLKDEGSSLNHCVASYIKDVLDGKTRIYFLRLKKKCSESLVTVEVKNGAIVQARGMHNRDLTSKEEKVLKAFGADRNLMYKIH